MEYPSYLEQRRRLSISNLSVLSRRVAKIPELKRFSRFSIYVTGSYGRLEASPRSDLDLFFILDDSRPTKIRKVDKLTKTLIDASLIRIIEKMGLPEFSNEGQYLEIHPLAEMVKTLGGPEDDYLNHFTARMLLLLESRPVYNPKAYLGILETIIQAYYRDYHDHERTFRPIFLVNDILRFWKTMCLNYENKRNISSTDALAKRKDHVRNLKLKFSRLMTCFSTVIPLCTSKYTSPSSILKLMGMAPIQRLRDVCGGSASNKRLLGKILEDYAWFLQTTTRPDILDWIAKQTSRDDAFGRARLFGNNVYELLSRTSHKEILRFLVI